MFDRTIQMAKQFMGDARAFVYYATLVTQGFFILYYPIAMILAVGNPVLHSILLALTAAAFLFFLCTERPRSVRPIKTRRIVRTVIRYMKHGVHICGVSLMLYTLYSTPEKASALAVILLVLSMLALLIQLICEVFGFVCRRYIEELIDTAVKDAEFLLQMAEKVQDGVAVCKNAKDAFAAIPERAERIGAGIKKKLSFFKRKKKDESLYEFSASDAEE